MVRLSAVFAMVYAFAMAYLIGQVVTVLAGLYLTAGLFAAFLIWNLATLLEEFCQMAADVSDAIVEKRLG